MVICQVTPMASYNTNFLNKLDNDYECNRSKMWYMSLRKALIILKSDLTIKSTKLTELDECISKLKNPAYGLLIELANEKMRDVTKSLEDFFVLFEDYNKLERMCETLSLVTGNDKPEKQLSPPKHHHNHNHNHNHHHHQHQQHPQPLHPPQLAIQHHSPPEPQPQPIHQPVQPQSQPQPQQQQQHQQQQQQQQQQHLQPPQQPTSSFNSLSLTPRAAHNQSPLSTPIRSFLIQTTDLFEEIKTPDKSLVPSSPFSAELKNFTTPIRILDDSPSTASLSTPKPTDNHSDSLSTPIATYYSNSYVVKDLMKDLKTPEKKQVPPSPLSVVIASSGIEDNTPIPQLNLSPARATTPIFVSSTKKTSTTTTTATISTDSSPTLPVMNLPRGVMRSKRVSLEKFNHYNSIGLKRRRAENAPVLAIQRQHRKLAPKTIVEITTSSSSSSSTQNPLTTQLLKNINVDQFLSKVHDKK